MAQRQQAQLHYVLYIDITSTLLLLTTPLVTLASWDQILGPDPAR